MASGWQLWLSKEEGGSSWSQDLPQDWPLGDCAFESFHWAEHSNLLPELPVPTFSKPLRPQVLCQCLGLFWVRAWP